MRVLITGGRHYSDQDLLEKTLNELHSRHGFTDLMHGDASGADQLAGQWAKSRGISVKAYPADWKNLGRIAGPIRNKKMLDEKPDLLVAFPGGKGTANMVFYAKKSGCVVVLVEG
jgi:hypothetical protein